MLLRGTFVLESIVDSHNGPLVPDVKLWKLGGSLVGHIELFCGYQIEQQKCQHPLILRILPHRKLDVHEVTSREGVALGQIGLTSWTSWANLAPQCSCAHPNTQYTPLLSFPTSWRHLTTP